MAGPTLCLVPHQSPEGGIRGLPRPVPFRQSSLTDLIGAATCLFASRSGKPRAVFLVASGGVQVGRPNTSVYIPTPSL